MTKSGLDHSAWVWHYTDVSALIGIVESGMLWATDSNFLNDRREATLANSLFEDAMDRASLPKNSPIRSGYAFQRGNRDSHMAGEDRWYVVCADSIKDHLNGWMHYSRGISLGCAIALDPAVPLGVVGADTAQRVRAWTPVIYGEQEQRQLSDSLMAELQASAERARGDSAEIFELEVNEVPSALNQIRGLAKDGYFRDEREQRTTVHDVPNRAIKFMGTSAGVRPYVRLAAGVKSWGEPIAEDRPRACLPIRAIQLAPGSSDAAVESVVLLLESCGYSFRDFRDPDGDLAARGVPVTKSKCSFRA